MKILVIDDDEDLRNLLDRYVHREWPDAVVDLIDPVVRDLTTEPDFPLGTYDVIVLDYQLGRGDGLAWLREFKLRPDCPKVLFLTGAGDESVAVRAMKSGADDYQRKQQITRERLIVSIRELASGSAERTMPTEVAQRIAGQALVSRIRIPGIRVLRLIGEGGTARVYLASRERDDEPLVVKVLKSEVMSDEQALSRFMEEYELIERLDSPHVARIHGHGQFEGLAYIVMEFFDGGDLGHRLGRKALPSGEASRIFRELMFALGDIHERGVLHRDLKPQNLMFRADGTLAIVDFGIAKHVDAEERTAQGEVVGTPRYMSPEQVQGRALDLRTDIYSAGVLFYQMLTGRHLFNGATALDIAMQHLHELPPALPEDLSGFQPLLDKLLDKDREARFRNADEVIGFLARKRLA